MTMTVLQEMADELRDMIDGSTETRGRDTRITLLIDKVESASHELAEAYAAIASVARIREAQRVKPGVWEIAYSNVIERAKADHTKVIA
jgi:hypothetical protein